MASFNHYNVHTHAQGSDHQRVKVDIKDTGFVLGRQFRAIVEVIKTSATIQFIRFTTPVPVYLQAVTVELDSGAARVSSVGGSTFGGTWTAVPVVGRNRHPTRPGYPKDTDTAYVAQATVSQAVSGTGTATGGTESNVRRVRCGAAAGNNSSSNASSESLLQLIPAGDYLIRVDPITGVANTDAVNGTVLLAWEEIPGAPL